MIDWWMMFCMVILVTTMVFHTFLNMLVRRANKEIAEEETLLLETSAEEYTKKLARTKKPG
jgi:hypothetical protein